MKASDIIKQLQIVLPTVTNAFSTVLNIVSVTPAGTTATATTVEDHGLSIGDVVNISGTLAPVVVSSITRVGEVATATTATPHDITEGVFNTVTLSGSNESEFNGTFPLLSANNRETFEFSVADSGATSATGAPLLEDPPGVFGYNGLVTITSVPGLKTFTYELPVALTEPAVGNGIVSTNIQITGAINLERAVEMYTKQTTTDALWAFVVLDTTVASKDRNTRNDAVTSAAPGSDRRQQLFQTFSVFVFNPTPDELSAREARDDMEDVMTYLFKALLYWQAPSELSASNGMGVVFDSHQFAAYNTAFYVHEFQFQILADVTEDDTVEPAFNVAFRDIDLTMNTSLGTEQLTASIDLDDEPITP